MDLESLTCNHCGAPLEVPRTANFVKCNHCGNQLAVRRSESATFTETVGQLAETTENLTRQVTKLTRQNEIDALDQRWERQREAFMLTDNNGHRHLPSEGTAAIGGIVAAVAGCIWTAMAIAITSSAPDFGPFKVAKFAFPAFGVVFVVFGIFLSVHTYRKAQDYQRAWREYRRQRDRLMRE